MLISSRSRDRAWADLGSTTHNILVAWNQEFTTRPGIGSLLDVLERCHVLSAIDLRLLRQVALMTLFKGFPCSLVLGIARIEPIAARIVARLPVHVRRSASPSSGVGQ